MLDPVRWQASTAAGPLPGKLRLLDQTRLPTTVVYLELDELSAIADAIKRLVVRGAPAIGIAAAMGLTAVMQAHQSLPPAAFLARAREVAAVLDATRPTAVNLGWALRRCLALIERLAGDGAGSAALLAALVQEAERILQADIASCRAIGAHGATLFTRPGMGVLTHCNAGALATGDYGTALAPIYTAHERGLAPRVFCDETRPLLQGARLTAWELQRAGVPATVICDNMAAQVLREGRVDLVIVGADRIAANGDTANKIGTYGLAILAHYHRVPFFVAAPVSTLDTRLADGAGIPIEQRASSEVTHGFGRQTAPDGIAVYNPAFDVTPATLIAGIITERGLFRPPYGPALAQAKAAETPALA